MKHKFLKRIPSLLLAAMSLSVCCSAALAANIMPLTAYQSADYSIAQGATSWSGKSDHLWTMTADETRFNISITSTAEKTVTGKLYKVVTLGPDTVVQTVTLTGKNGDWDSSVAFIPSTTASHYAVVTTQEAYGVTGRVSVQ